MRLLRKIVGSYFLLSVILLILAVPVFYYALKRMMVANIDENLLTTKTLLLPRLRESLTNNLDSVIHYYNYDIGYRHVIPDKAGDTISTVELMDSVSNEWLPARMLSSGFYVNREFYRLQIKTSLADKFALVQRIVVVLMVVLLFLLLGSLLLNRILSQRIFRPFYDTLKRLHDYRVDKQGRLELKKSSIREFNDLNLAIEQLTERDHRAYLSQKEFAENASHEMQSPLAVFQSKLELLMQTKPLNEDQAALIEDLANASGRMSRLNRSLILLTQIGNNQFPGRETIPLGELIEHLAEQYSFQVAQKEISLEIETVQDISVQANRTLMEILVSNLLSNAIRHNVTKGRIVIRLEHGELSISNTGKPEPLNTQKVFLRFHKESTDPTSIGLGLEILQKICDMNQFIFSYDFQNGFHRFSIRFTPAFTSQKKVNSA
jgi:signal transduction histidine kinase